MNKLELIIAGDLPEVVSAAPFESVVAVINALQPEWLQSGTIGLKLVDDASIRELNKEYAGHDYTTDVLSFPYLEDAEKGSDPFNASGKGSDPETELGDIVISLDTARAQAEAAGTGLDDELGTLTAHGILHIFGLDHLNAAESSRMDALQKEIVEAANLTYRDFKWIH